MKPHYESLLEGLLSLRSNRANRRRLKALLEKRWPQPDPTLHPRLFFFCQEYAKRSTTA